jgi:hypothetical protein
LWWAQDITEGIMTKNRARIRATKELAASSDIRHPDASYLADHRKLRLPDGTVHDFSKGPLRYLGIPGSGAGAAALQVTREAATKGWATMHYTESLAESGFAPHDVAGAMGPSLIIVNTSHETGAAMMKAIVDLDAGTYPDLNVLIIRDPIPGEHRRSPATGRNIFLAAASPVLLTGGPGSSRNADLLARVQASNATREALDTLGIPEAAQEFTAHTAGLFLITGTTGQGKTTTGAALLLRAYCDKGHSAAAIMLSCESFFADYPGVKLYEADYEGDTAPAIRAAVGDGAQIIFVDGLRDAEAIEAALDAALGGALVFATMHTQASDAAQRLLDAFPDSCGAKIRAKVELALSGVLEQVLVHKANGQGRILASELWIGNEGGLSPVLTLEESLKSLVDQGAADPLAADKVIIRRW